MPKPIIVINYNERELKFGGRQISFAEIQDMFSGKFTDYHVLCVPINNPEEFVPLFELKVFYEKDFTDIQYNELKNLVEEKLKELKQVDNGR